MIVKVKKLGETSTHTSKLRLTFPDGRDQDIDVPLFGDIDQAIKPQVEKWLSERVTKRQNEIIRLEASGYSYG